MTKSQARELVDDFEVERVFRDEEELELLEENNPELLGAYRALMKLAGIPIEP